MEKNLSEEEKKEKVKNELKKIWDELTLTLDNNSTNGTDAMKNKINDHEFKRIMDEYLKQNRPLESFENLLVTLNSLDGVAESRLQKLSLFYKDIVYNPEEKNEKNREDSLNFALPYVDLLNLTHEDKKNFKKLMN